ncbi:MAG: nucleotidyltransferase domain-containing protein [bacterium]
MACNNPPKILEAFSRDLVSRTGDRIFSIIWFGSTARGEGTQDSDFDVTIIATDENKDLWDTTIDVVAEHSLENDCLISILLFSKERFEKMKSIGRLLARNIERDGITLWNRAA